MAKADHIVLAVRNLDQTAALFTDRLGLASYRGGRIAGLGTESVIVPIGTSYLELIAISDEREATTNPLGRAVLRATGKQEASFISWAVQPGESLQPTADRLELMPHLMKRSLPDGGDVPCNIAGLQQALEEPPLPYFVEWQSTESHPSAVDVEHSNHPTGLAWIEVAGDKERLQAWLGDSSLPLQFVDGQPGIRGFSILTEGQPVVLREPLQLEALPPLQPALEKEPQAPQPEEQSGDRKDQAAAAAEPAQGLAAGEFARELHDEKASAGELGEGRSDAAPVSCESSVLQAVLGSMEQAVEAVESVAGHLLTPAGQQPEQ